ncbi:extracellular catalytic domain type 1 short-chain-length polyhydroxyalkanoate depolymerase [Microvirga arsenatis]|uniref:PHB depolymerase family esterase n=1 Tax=Microvirga arsenatis TaxID=2692265 RepID=A0ABW9YUB6_9HYPH|nr:PHB depolymerase family esterase [Microvirga arsenatis]NBJ23979.1 PHB depolymerase family esterase [Microvirga arsenatis]
MQRLGQIIPQLARYRRQWEAAMKKSNGASASFKAPPAPSRLTELHGFGPNPGDLRMLAYVPRELPPSPALVVVLHGCTQTAAGYDHGSGWSALADRYGFILIYPEQQESNNPKRCFNWFQLGDIERDRGEAYSIRQMVEHAIKQHNVDRSRVFVTGLSAGGAMTATMLATYPDVFAAGAIIAGLPYRCATSVPEAFECMFQGQTRPAQEWGDLVRSASPHRGPWPKVSVWHGSADTTVKPMNAGEIIKQWTDVHDLKSNPSDTETVDGHLRRVWTDATGTEVIEEYVISGMGHGTPLAVGSGENSYGAAGPFLLDVGISSSHRIAEFWGLTGESERAAWSHAPQSAARPEPKPGPSATPPTTRIESPRERDRPEPSHLDIGAVITKALRSAGLMK